MQKHECDVCGYVYEPEKGDSMSNVPAGTSFEDVDATWVCPLCGADKSNFTPV